jgi:hypothetical protein
MDPTREETAASPPQRQNPLDQWDSHRRRPKADRSGRTEDDGAAAEAQRGGSDDDADEDRYVPSSSSSDHHRSRAMQQQQPRRAVNAPSSSSTPSAAAKRPEQGMSPDAGGNSAAFLLFGGRRGRPLAWQWWLRAAAITVAAGVLFGFGSAIGSRLGRRAAASFIPFMRRLIAAAADRPTLSDAGAGGAPRPKGKSLPTRR